MVNYHGKTSLLFADQFDDIARTMTKWCQWCRIANGCSISNGLTRRFGWKPRKILDVATGTGRWRWFAGTSGLPGYGIDISERMIEVRSARKAANRWGGGGSGISSRWRHQSRLPRRSSTWRSACLTAWIISSPPTGCSRLFSGVFRALRPGGGFYIWPE